MHVCVFVCMCVCVGECVCSCMYACMCTTLSEILFTKQDCISAGVAKNQ